MDDLISKRKLEEALICGLCHSEKTDDYNNGLWDALRVAEAIKPVNAVELPCKIGNTIYELLALHDGDEHIVTHIVKGITISDEVALIHCETKNFFWCDIGDSVFLTKEEAEEALEDLKNENR